VSLHDIAAHLLSETYQAIMQCYPSSCCEPIAAYVSAGDGDDGVKDALTVAVTGVAPSPNTVPGQFGLYKAGFNVRLRESGWPTARQEGDVLVLPTPAEQSAAARHVFAMGEAMHRRLAFLNANRSMTPPGTRCSNATLGPLTPLRPQGGVIGWLVQVTVDLPWN
jgi:hypothetical protein